MYGREGFHVMIESLLIGIISPAFLLYLIYIRTQKDKDINIAVNVIRCFILGMLIVLPISFLEETLMKQGLPTANLGIMLSNLLIIAPLEELGKLAIVFSIIKNKINLKTPPNLIIFSVAGAMGFALIENIIYVANGGIATGLLRAISSVPMHASTAVIIGIFGSYEIIENNKNHWWIGFLIAVLMHTFYNVYAMFFSNSFLFVGIFIIAFGYMIICDFLIGYILKNKNKEEGEDL